MSVGTSRAKLMTAYKDLRHRWGRSRDAWDDEAAQRVGETIIDPLEPRVRAAVTAMEKMQQVLLTVRKQCE